MATSRAPGPVPGAPSPLEAQLSAARQDFLRFVRGRVSDPDLAEDIVQDALLRAVQSADTLRDEDRVIPWFYRILRNAIIDAWDGTEAHGRALLVVIKGLKGLQGPAKRGAEE